VGRGSWVAGRGSWVVGRGSWVVGRGSWVVVGVILVSKFVPQDDGPLLIFELILNGCFAPAWGGDSPGPGGLPGGLPGLGFANKICPWGWGI
jgi:hypothetical protein